MFICSRRHEVADISFGLVLPGENEPSSDPPAPPASSSRATPNTSAKRRRLETDTAKSTRSQTTRRSTRSNALEAAETDAAAAASSARVQSARRRATESPAYDEDSVERLPDPARGSPALERVSGAVVEEIGESPEDDPGSGRRRRVRVGAGVASSSSRLQEILRDASDDAAPAVSSPLARKARASDSGVSATGRRSTGRRASRRQEVVDDEDELSPEKASSLLEGRGKSPDLSSSALAPVPEEEEAHAEPDEAEAVDVASAVRALGRKRPRESLRALSPDPISPAVDVEEPATKRRKKQVQASPAKQKQGKARETRRVLEDTTANAPAVAAPSRRPRPPPEDVEELPTPDPKPKKTKRASLPKPAAKPRKSISKPAEKPPRKSKKQKPSASAKERKAARSEGEGEEEEDDDAPIPIVVQRFTKPVRVDEADPDAVDILSTDVPFASRGGVNTVDVLAQICEEVLDHSLHSLETAASAAADASARKEFRVKLRAMEAFQEELRTRLLDHVSFAMLPYPHWSPVDTSSCLRSRRLPPRSPTTMTDTWLTPGPTDHRRRHAVRAAAPRAGRAQGEARAARRDRARAARARAGGPAHGRGARAARGRLGRRRGAARAVDGAARRRPGRGPGPGRGGAEAAGAAPGGGAGQSRV